MTAKGGTANRIKRQTKWEQLLRLAEIQINLVASSAPK